MDEIQRNVNKGLCRGSILNVRSADRLKTGRYRVLNIRNGLVTLCEMDVSSFKLNVQVLTYLQDMLYDGMIEIESEEKLVFDYEKLSEYQKNIYTRNLSIVNAVADAYGPDYLDLATHKPKPLLKKLEDEYGLSNFTVRRIIRLYIQSGFNNSSLLDQAQFMQKKQDNYSCYAKKTGRKCENVITGKCLTSEDIAHFAEALEKYKKGRKKTFKSVFLLMSDKYYSEEITCDDGTQLIKLLPASERPSFRQFTYYCSKHLSKEEKDRIKTSAMEQRNNKRLLLSDSRYNVEGPADRVQMDEVEVDMSIVSSLDPSITVGRPIVYVMHDVFGSNILAIGISFDNNSVLGMTNCFLNLAQNKVEYCARYGITISEDMWPSCYLPGRILVDRGAEYRSYEAKRIFRELNIHRELAPAGSGSMKGLVEQWFHQMHSSQNPSLEKHGLIEKRHDSKHHKEACLTIDDFTVMLINFVIHHNCSVLSDYPLTADMISKRVDPVPVEIFKYGCEKYGTPKPISNIPQYYFSLMLPQSAKYDRRGIRCNDLFYINRNDHELLADMYNAHTKRIKFPVRIDPRDVGSVYYIRNNRIMRASLNSDKTGNADVTGMTLSEWTLIIKSLRARRRSLEINKQQFDAYIEKVNELIVKNAKKVVTNQPATQNLLENRAKEKHLESNSLRMFDYLNQYLDEQFGETVSASLSEAEMPNTYEVLDCDIDDENTNIGGLSSDASEMIETRENSDDFDINIAENPAAYLEKLLAEGWTPGGDK